MSFFDDPAFWLAAAGAVGGFLVGGPGGSAAGAEAGATAGGAGATVGATTAATGAATSTAAGAGTGSAAGAGTAGATELALQQAAASQIPGAAGVQASNAAIDYGLINGNLTGNILNAAPSYASEASYANPGLFGSVKGFFADPRVQQAYDYGKKGSQIGQAVNATAPPPDKNIEIQNAAAPRVAPPPLPSNTNTPQLTEEEIALRRQRGLRTGLFG